MVGGTKMTSRKRNYGRAFSLLVFLLCLPLMGTQNYRAAGQGTIAIAPEPAATTMSSTPSLLSPSCPPQTPPSYIQHAFTESAVISAAEDSSKLIIVSHGASKRLAFAQFSLAKSYEEFVPVFVSRKRKIANLSKEQLIKILKGEITDWQELGDTQAAIVLYLHSGVYQKLSFEKFLETLGLTPADLKARNVKSSSDYGDLESMAGKDPDALVIGLRELEPEGLKTVSIDGASILDVRNLEQYPLHITVNLFERDTPEAAKPLKKVIKQIDKNNPLDNIYNATLKQGAEPNQLKRH
jgi:hypothetical protein